MARSATLFFLGAKVAKLGMLIGVLTLGLALLAGVGLLALGCLVETRPR